MGEQIIDYINDRLRYRNKPIWYGTFKRKLKELSPNNVWHKSFDGILGIYKINDNNDELPF